MHYFDVIVIGAGGAGLMCAALAGQRGRKVCVIDHNYKVGRKILISGGGRCNFTNINASPENYISNNPHFCKSALSRYTADDFISLVKKHRIQFHEKKLGQLFCNQSAQQIVDMLMSECQNGSVHFKLATRISTVEKNSHDLFVVATSHDTLSSKSLVIATGGLSIPQIGATGFGYDLARQFGMAIIEPEPALVGLSFSKKDRPKFEGLAGVSIDSVVSCRDSSFRENILFTHTGLSGPAILQSSLYWQTRDPIVMDLSPATDLLGHLMERKQAGSKMEVKNVLAEILPKRFIERWCELFYSPKTVAELSERSLQELAEMLSNWELRPGTTVGFSKAEVTRGGVDTAELSSKTMEAKKVPGLFFIGEVVDVTGQLGGYNFQWAWSSAFATAQAV